MSNSFETATFAGGCFWCFEAIFKRLKGVTSVISGFSGGIRENPSSEDVYTQTTGHAEAVQVTFDPTKISYERLLTIFFTLHDPTTLNKQNYDIGPQYRSSIFYHSPNQQQQAENSRKSFQDKYPEKIVTEIVPLTKFYKAEDYHQDFYEKNKQYSYCQLVIDPKINKLIEMFNGEIKEEYLN